MERMVAREHIKLPRQQQLPALRARLPSPNRHEPVLQVRDVLLDRVRRLRRVVHLLLELVDVRGVALERVRVLLFEVVDDDEVGEEGEDVLDFEDVGGFEELNGAGGGGSQASVNHSVEGKRHRPTS